MGAAAMISKYGKVMVLLTAFLAVFLQATCGGPRWLLGAQVDLLPGLMVYVGLTFDAGMIALLALVGGLGFDSLSANPEGVSVVPLLAIGVLVHANRAVILRKEIFARFVLGLTASAAAPVLTLMLLLTLGETPIVGWTSLWQLVVMALGGGLLTPLLFAGLDKMLMAVTYPSMTPAFQASREVKRGRS
jgi:cell shape-determining protein MreD